MNKKVNKEIIKSWWYTEIGNCLSHVSGNLTEQVHPETLFWHSFWHTIWQYIWHIYSYIHTDILCGIYFDILSDILSDILYGIYNSDIFSGSLSGIYSILTFFLALYLTFSLVSGRGPAVPIEIWHSRLMSGSAGAWEKQDLVLTCLIGIKWGDGNPRRK